MATRSRPEQVRLKDAVARLTKELDLEPADAEFLMWAFKRRPHAVRGTARRKGHTGKWDRSEFEASNTTVLQHLLGLGPMQAAVASTDFVWRSYDEVHVQGADPSEPMKGRRLRAKPLRPLLYVDLDQHQRQDGETTMNVCGKRTEVISDASVIHRIRLVTKALGAPPIFIERTSKQGVGIWFRTSTFLLQQEQKEFVEARVRAVGSELKSGWIEVPDMPRAPGFGPLLDAHLKKLHGDGRLTIEERDALQRDAVRLRFQAGLTNAHRTAREMEPKVYRGAEGHRRRPEEIKEAPKLTADTERRERARARAKAEKQLEGVEMRLARENKWRGLDLAFIARMLRYDEQLDLDDLTGELADPGALALEAWTNEGPVIEIPGPDGARLYWRTDDFHEWRRIESISEQSFTASPSDVDDGAARAAAGDGRFSWVPSKWCAGITEPGQTQECLLAVAREAIAYFQKWTDERLAEEVLSFLKSRPQGLERSGHAAEIKKLILSKLRWWRKKWKPEFTKRGARGSGPWDQRISAEEVTELLASKGPIWRPTGRLDMKALFLFSTMFRVAKAWGMVREDGRLSFTMGQRQLRRFIGADKKHGAHDTLKTRLEWLKTTTLPSGQALIECVSVGEQSRDSTWAVGLSAKGTGAYVTFAAGIVALKGTSAEAILTKATRDKAKVDPLDALERPSSRGG